MSSRRAKSQAVPTATLDILVQPRASRAEIVGFHDGALKIRVTAPPVDGAANAAIEKLLASSLGLSKSQVAIIGGQTSKRKRVRVDGLNQRELNSRLTEFAKDA
ncbi:MAG: DUF167 domain-containing protein [Thermomicrobiales bacterium]|nr:DUF167 domain-containing protein [Thermomicrobiales bacterium]